MTERILHWYGISHGLRSVSLRYFNAAGASADSRIGEDWRQSLNLVPLIMKATLGRRPPVKVFGNDYPTADGTCIRDYIHVDDLADAHVKALDHLARGGQSTALNVGTGRGSTVMEVIGVTERLTGRAVPWEPAPRRAGDPVAVYADPTRAAQLLDWHPAHDLDDIVASAWQWHSTHLDGYDKSPSP
jgi:UDP-glucose 4-epimerase